MPRVRRRWLGHSVVAEGDFRSHRARGRSPWLAGRIEPYEERWGKTHRFGQRAVLALVAIAAALSMATGPSVAGASGPSSRSATPAATSTDWPVYAHDLSNTRFNAKEDKITLSDRILEEPKASDGE